MRQLHGDLDETAAATPPRPLRVAMGAVAALCVLATLAHVLLMFLHVAPPNPISQRYSAQIDAWIYPLFEQNWKLFAPVPESSNAQIFARTGWVTASGERQASDWIDISSVDNADTRHDPYPSRTTQNMLRLAWANYVSTHGDNDAADDDWALLRAKFLRNVAVQRVRARSPRPFEAIRLKVVTRPIPPPSTGNAGQTDATETYTRILPWWNVTPDGS